MNWKTRKLPDFTRRRIASTMPEGTCSARVLRQIEAKARQYWSRWDRDESRYVQPTVRTVRGKDYLFLDRRHHESRGKPKRDAMRAYVTALLLIYERATGTKLGRINIEVLDGDHPQYRAKHIPFLQACVRAVGQKYPSRIVQEVIKGR